MRAEEFDKKFDDNQEDIVEYLDLPTLRRPNQEMKSIKIDVPVWMIKSLDQEAKHIGISTQAVIKTWLAERIDQVTHQRAI
ncbi:MAG: CopG family transcriptional regulator [Campylobacterales bacterium]|nr:CopG family transcriptional regulator [Campylobacterales bacterium]